MNLDEIKLKFENHSYDIRMDFINEYDFKDKYRDYYHQFILQAINVKSHLYLSDLIDLAAWLEFYDNELYDRYVSYLYESRHYVVKLASLDYLLDFTIKCDNDKKLYENILLKFMLIARHKITYNQTLLNLIALHNENEKQYEKQLFLSIKNTQDWKSIYRILRVINERNIFSKNKKDITKFIANLSAKYDYPEGVRVLLEKYI